jgi:hypothetical protein
MAHIAALTCYFAAYVMALLFGVRYLRTDRFMPYHRAAIGADWESLDHGLRVAILGMLKIVGGGMLSTAATGLVIILLPFRAGEAWATYAAPVPGLCLGLPTIYATLYIEKQTGAATPVRPAAAFLLLLLAGFCLSLL